MGSITNAPLYVWTSPTWTSPSWTRRDRLRANGYINNPSGNSTASFSIETLNRNTKTGTTGDTFSPAVGMAIAISPEPTSYSQSTTLWAGIIEDISSIPLRNIADSVGNLTAIGFGNELKRRRVENIRMKDITPAAVASGVPLESPPTFNLKTDRGELLGNAVTGETVSGVAYKQLAVRTSDLGTKWTRKDVANHVIHYCWPDTLPSVKLIDSLSSSPMADTSLLEAWEIAHLPLQEALDLIICNTLGLSWEMLYSASASSWIINVIPVSDLVSGVTAVSASFNNGDDSLHLHEVPRYDAVEVKANRIVACGTMSCKQQQGSIAGAWSSTLETDYSTNAPSDFDAEKNKEYRCKPQFKDIFSRYEVTCYTPYFDQFCKGGAGNDWTTVSPMCRKVDWDGSTATVSTTETASPNLAASGVLDWIPWYAGVQVDGTDNRTADQKKQPKTLDIHLFTNPDNDGSPLWRNLLAPAHDGHHKPVVSVEANSPSLIVKYPYPEVMALNHWTSVGNGGDAKYSSRSPDNTETYEASDYKDLVATLAMETDQRIKVTKTRSGVTTVGRKLEITRNDLHFWYVNPYTVLGVASNAPVETTGTTIIRNDWAYAESIATQAATWAFRSRTEMTLTLKGYAVPSWAKLGNLIGNLIEKYWNGSAYVVGKTYSINCIVKQVSVSLDPKNPSVTITTEAPTYIDKAIPGLGGSLHVAVSKLSERTAEMERQLNKNKEAGDLGSGNPPNLVEQIALPSHGFVAGNVITYAGGTWVKAIATSADVDKNLGIVGRVLDTGHFLLVKWGNIFLDGTEGVLTRGTYYVSPTVAGAYVNEATIDAAVAAYKADRGTPPSDYDVITIIGPSAPPAYKRAIFEYQGVDGIVNVYGARIAGTHSGNLSDLLDVYVTAVSGDFTSVLRYNNGEFISSSVKALSAGPGLTGTRYDGSVGRVFAVNFPTAGVGDNGILNQASRADHTHPSSISISAATLYHGTGLLGGSYDARFDETFSVDYSVTFTGSNNGFVPHPTTTSGTRVLADNGTWISLLPGTSGSNLSGFTNPMSAHGDIITGDISGGPLRVAGNAGTHPLVLISKQGDTRFQPYKLGTLEDVSTVGAANQQVLSYTASTSSWGPSTEPLRPAYNCTTAQCFVGGSTLSLSGFHIASGGKFKLRISLVGANTHPGGSTESGFVNNSIELYATNPGSGDPFYSGYVQTIAHNSGSAAGGFGTIADPSGTSFGFAYCDSDGVAVTNTLGVSLTYTGTSITQISLSIPSGPNANHYASMICEGGS